ncbi:hypothetical protein JCGZ_18156 [Jatropha curcas]|uniref:Uncharacterized protein n=1 Tax=Jatropha curcas TaxID=180498 RepID=A0A067KEP8_JATCU|nr:hypothetical protein JCGZ_18156 [Jatropha curcas]
MEVQPKVCVHHIGNLVVLVALKRPDLGSDRTGQTAQGMLETHLVSPYWMSPPSSTHVSIADYNKVSQLYEMARLKLVVARLSNEHVSRASMSPLVGRGRGAQHGGHVGRGAVRRSVVVKETEDSDSEDLEETTLNMS